jgi:Tfp pilus assembly protein FimT
MSHSRQLSSRRFYSRRYGKSLIEALIIISLMSIIIGLAATSLASLFRLRYVMVRDAEQAASLDRLAMRLRLDAHEAISAAAENGYLLKSADGRTIQYSFAAPRIVREVRRDDKLIHRDSFPLQRYALATFDDDSLSRGLLRVMIEPEQTKLPPRELPRTAKIEAALSIHGQLARSGGRP